MKKTKRLRDYAPGLVIVAVIIGAALTFKGQQQKTIIPSDAMCTVVRATKDVPMGAPITYDSVQEAMVKLISIPSDYVSNERANATAEVAGKVLDYYSTQKGNVVGRQSFGIKKDQLIVHTLMMKEKLGGADFLPVPNQP